MRIIKRMAAAAAVTVVLQVAHAQDGTPALSGLAAYAKRIGETPRNVAAAAAATRGLNLCSGRWQGGLTDEIIERDLNGRDPSLGSIPNDFVTGIDEIARTVSVTYDADMPPRHVVWRPVLGCVQLPIGAPMDAAQYLPRIDVAITPPNFDDQPWPMGDRKATARLPRGQRKALADVVDAAFDGTTYGGASWAVLVVADGKIVAEKYARGFDMHMGSQTHSAAKSFAASVVGIASGQGLIDIHQPGPLTAWRKPGDPRGAITLEHLLRMSSGLYTQGHGSPLQKIYAQGGTVADLAATNVLDSQPGTHFVYSPPDTMLAVRAVREAIHDDQRFLQFPFRELYWRIGMTRTSTNSEWNGDFLMSGQTWSSARDFARFGLLYLNDGVWQGERILPQGWVDYVTTRGPAQPPRPPYYGAQFWLYGGMAGLPDDAFSPSGGQGHYAMVIRSRNVVIVRRGFDLPGENFDITRFCADVLSVLKR
ncbi:MAG: serine hydrolase [Gammaproteobacteria bacterium]|nr:serine hydrolase [Gammaproteobacteria bacterium]